MLFTRNRVSDTEQLVCDILDSMGRQMVLVVRQCRAEPLYANAAARQAFPLEQSCREFCGRVLPMLCTCCPNRSDDCSEDETVRHLQGDDDHWYAVEASEIIWADRKPAILLLLQNADDETINAQKLYDLAYTDSLTGLPNREKLHLDFERIAGEGGDLCGAVALFDMDHFKGVNDTYGHNAGNALLKRLAQHLQGNPGFRGHVYRLGGDEFVFFFAVERSRFRDETALREHFEGLLQSAFYSYTMPGIELECTISMGVAFLPSHGQALSELLRKADIALYQAKDSGRNRMVVFEDWQDTARKFTDYFINIRPVLSATGETFGYELADNLLLEQEREDKVNLNMSEFNQAVDALDPGDLERDIRYFIRYTAQLGSGVVLHNLPRERFIIQIPAEGPDWKLLRNLRDQGYSLIGDLPPGPAETLLELADYVRVGPGETGKAKGLIARFPGKLFLAAGIDTARAYDKAKQMGFVLFQGSYFTQPVIVKTGKDMDPLKVNYFRLLSMTSTDRFVDFRKIAEVISMDMAMTYKLLRLLNSAATGLRGRISSVSMAVAYLGEDTLKKWIALLALRGLMTDKPMEIVRISLIRARFGELLAPEISSRWDLNQVFLTGMFSLLHVAMDTSKEALVEELSLADDIRLSLLTETGAYSELLSFFGHYEYSNWEEVADFARRHGLDCKRIYSHYITAVKWYNTLVDADALQEAMESR